MALNTLYSKNPRVKNLFFYAAVRRKFPSQAKNKNLFSLKYDTGSCFLKSMHNLVRLTWENSVLTRGFLLYPGNLRPYFLFLFSELFQVSISCVLGLFSPTSTCKT